MRIVCAITTILVLMLISPVLLALASAQSQPLSPDQKIELLNAQNKYREEVCDAPLTWSDDLATTAQAQAKICADSNSMIHSNNNLYGENIVYTGLSHNLNVMVDSWGEEKQNFIDGVQFGNAASSTGDWHAIGHYTQMIWHDTTQCGCGLTQNSVHTFLVCQYTPKGNMVGQYVIPINPPSTPSQPTGPSTGTIGTSYSYSTSATDPDGDQVKYTFDWGDGTPPSQTNLVNSETPSSASHAWTVPGTYQVKAMASDCRGLPSAAWSSPLTVTITTPNRPPNKPVISKNPHYTNTKYFTGVCYCFFAHTTDPDGDQVQYHFDFGIRRGYLPWTKFVSPIIAQKACHRWESPGTFYVRVMARDPIGATSEWSDAIPVIIEKTPFGFEQNALPLCA